MGRRVSAKQLAAIWLVTTERVGQLARAGKIHKGADGLFDLDEAVTFRRQQIGDHEVNTMLKSYGSRHGTVTRMKALDHLLSAEEVLADDDGKQHDDGDLSPPALQLSAETCTYMEALFYEHAGDALAVTDKVAAQLGDHGLDDRTRDAISAEIRDLLLKLKLRAFVAGLYR